MHFLIRRYIRTNPETGQDEYQQFQIRTRQLTIGRAPSQHVQITEHVVNSRHAIISQDRHGHVSINAVSSNGFKINGEFRKKALLSPGDSIQIGSSSITVEKTRADHPVVLTVDIADTTNQQESLHHTSIQQVVLSKKAWSWIFAISILSIFFLIPVSGVLSLPAGQFLRDQTILPDDSLWLSGPLHQSHQVIGKECDACHTTPFKMVENSQCIECHSETQHHLDASSQDVQLFEHTRCAGCHREHNEPSSLVQRDQRFCTDCHGELDRLKKDTELANVTDFSNDHPGFRLTLLEPFFAQQQTQWKPIRIESDARSTVSEHSSLQFSHKQHLDPKGIRSPDGDQLLGCDDCHRLNTSGREMLPIVMEEHCGSCHKLAIDENDPDKRVPHGDLAALYDTLKECFSLRYLEPLEQADALQLSEDMPRRPGGNKRALSKAEQKRALDWVDKQSLLVAQDIIEDRVCIDCHQISRIQGASGIEQWYVKPVVLNMQWMPFARFDHTSHASESCTNCHENADQSTTSSDILMPEIETCQECHGGENQPDKLVSDCVMCHRFHLPGRGLLDEKERATSIKESLDEMKNREVSAPSDTDKNH